MKILLDHNVPAQLRRQLPGYLILTAREMRWDRLRNGDLLTAAQSGGFDLMITGDQNLIYQQNNADRALALIVLTQIKRSLVTAHHSVIREAIQRASPASFELVSIPRESLGIRAVK